IPVCARLEYSVKPAFRDLVSIRFATRLSSERWRTALSSPTVLTNTCWRSRRMRAIVLWSPHYGTWKRLRICSAALPKLGKLRLGRWAMTALAPHIAAFLHVRLPAEQGASEHTRDSYSYAFQLLFTFAGEKLKISPSSLQLEHLDAPLILSFLENLESVRANKAASRNVRLAAIKSFMRFVEHRVPSAIEQVRRILAIPAKKADIPLVGSLFVDEMKAILETPVPTTRMGIRDRAMLLLGFTAGLRVSELVGLRLENVSLQLPASIFVRGKGRRERNLPLCRETAQALRAWLAIRGQALVPELFLNARDKQMTRSGFEY